MKTLWTTHELCQKLGLSKEPGEGAPEATKPHRLGNVVLTGATGWLGRHLARQLLRQTRATLHLLVRTQTGAGFLWATPPLEQESRTHQWQNRVVIHVVGDLQTGDLPDLAFDTLIHSAGDMSLAKSIDELWASNVTATQRLWDWAHQSCCQSFHAISTLSVAVGGLPVHGAGREIVMEEDSLMHSSVLHGNYAASKWAMDAWLQGQPKDTMALCTHRPGLLTVSDEEGFLAHDPVRSVLAMVAQEGVPSWMQCGQLPHPASAPANATGKAAAFDWSPVDQVAAHIVRAVRFGGRGVLNWAADRPVEAGRFFDQLNTLTDKRCETWSHQTPVAKTALRAMERWHSPDKWARHWWVDLFQTDRHHFDCHHARMLTGDLWSRPDPLAWSRLLELAQKNP